MKELYFKYVKNILKFLYYKHWFKLNFLSYFLTLSHAMTAILTSLHVEVSK